MRLGQKRICGTGDRVDKWFRLGRRTLAREINAVNIVRRMRMIENYLEKEVTAKEHKKMKYIARRKALAALSSDNSPDEMLEEPDDRMINSVSQDRTNDISMGVDDFDQANHSGATYANHRSMREQEVFGNTVPAKLKQGGKKRVGSI